MSRERQLVRALGAEWLVIAPLGVWGIRALWVPLSAPTLGPAAAWLMTLAIALLAGVSLAGHVLAHALAARLAGGSRPARMPLYLFGDAAQSWPPAPTPWREALAALAGPAASLLLGGAAYLAWDAQLLPAFDACTLFAAYFNLALAMVNLAPGLPFDGARVTRALGWGWLRRPDRGAGLVLWLGRLFVAALVVWGAYALVQQVRFSLEVGVGTLLGAALLALALWRQPRLEQPPLDAARRPSALGRAVRRLVAATLLAGMTGAAWSMLPLLQGVYAPGPALAVEPMVMIAPAYRHPYAGTFLLTTVITQTPIALGQWMQALFDPAVEVVPPEQVVPPGITPQEQVRQYVEMLEESEAVATVVGLRQAGYQASISSTAAEVLAVLPESAAQGLLQPGDWIVAVSGVPVTTTQALIAQLAAQPARREVELTILRERLPRRLTVTLLAPAALGGPPRIGITVQSVGYTVDLPFPVQIEPHKIGGGPSAGLMFALTVYNLVTPEDLTHGQRIAGTGTIALDGTVGPIGGVAQKVVAAERAGATVFLAPVENYDQARQAARRIRVVPVATIQAAIAFLRRL